MASKLLTVHNLKVLALISQRGRRSLLNPPSLLNPSTRPIPGASITQLTKHRTPPHLSCQRLLSSRIPTTLTALTGSSSRSSVDRHTEGNSLRVVMARLRLAVAVATMVNTVLPETSIKLLAPTLLAAAPTLGSRASMVVLVTTMMSTTSSRRKSSMNHTLVVPTVAVHTGVVVTRPDPPTIEIRFESRSVNS